MFFGRREKIWFGDRHYFLVSTHRNINKETFIQSRLLENHEDKITRYYVRSDMLSMFIF